VTAAGLARDTALAVELGVGAVHVHIKDHAGIDTFGGAELSVALTAIRAVAPTIPIGVTTGAWALPDPAARVAAIRSWSVVPDFASVNWHEDGADVVAAVLLDRCVGVEAGLWHADGIDAWLASPHRDQCLRVLIELPDGLDDAGTVTEADRLLDRWRTGTSGSSAARLPIVLHGEGSSCWPALRHAARLRFHSRIGLEDTLKIPDGSLALDNAALVRAAFEILSGCA
jgi:uncharacterized protein (DUF849 family)